MLLTPQGTRRQSSFTIILDVLAVVATLAIAVHCFVPFMDFIPPVRAMTFWQSFWLGGIIGMAGAAMVGWVLNGVRIPVKENMTYTFVMELGGAVIVAMLVRTMMP